MTSIHNHYHEHSLQHHLGSRVHPASHYWRTDEHLSYSSHMTQVMPRLESKAGYFDQDPDRHRFRSSKRPLSRTETTSNPPSPTLTSSSTSSTYSSTSSSPTLSSKKATRYSVCRFTISQEIQQQAKDGIREILEHLEQRHHEYEGCYSESVTSIHEVDEFRRVVHTRRLNPKLLGNTSHLESLYQRHGGSNIQHGVF
ncbi:hypothetical protein B0O80DRAFT_532238 [Mortierella sp. GBAus27b]|nr:hypothetical protein B0O80DRAFT_532238 [Mortierella sp. GBAus27b]